jgi:hypothetical protein
MKRIYADKKTSISIQEDGFQMTTEKIRVNPPDPRYPRAIITDDGMTHKLLGPDNTVE